MNSVFPNILLFFALISPFFSAFSSEEQEVSLENQAFFIFQQAEEELKNGHLQDALRLYLLQSNLGSKDQTTTFHSLYKSGMIFNAFGDFEEALKCFLKAHTLFPQQIEPLFHSATIYRELGYPFLGYLLMQHTLSLPSADVSKDPNLLIELANCALLSNDWKEGLKACNKLLTLPSLSEEYLPSIRLNKKLAEENLSVLKVDFDETKEKVSIICPTYNRHDRHPNLYQAFCHQSYPNKELLIVDDSPTPSPFFSQLKDPRVKYIKLHKQASIGFKRNLLIGMASGELIAHFDDDDYYAPNYLEVMVNRLQNQDLVKLSTWLSWRESDGSCWEWDTKRFEGKHFIIAGDHLDQPIYDCQEAEKNDPDRKEIHIQGSLQNSLGFGFSYLYRKSLWLEVPFEDLYGGEDYHFIQQAITLGKKIATVDDLAHLCLHVLHSQNTSYIYPQRSYDPSNLITSDPFIKNWMINKSSNPAL